MSHGADRRNLRNLWAARSEVPVRLDGRRPREELRSDKGRMKAFSDGAAPARTYREIETAAKWRAGIAARRSAATRMALSKTVRYWWPTSHQTMPRL